jgi:hypothetical protein
MRLAGEGKWAKSLYDKEKRGGTLHNKYQQLCMEFSHCSKLKTAAVSSKSDYITQ